ncbi:MAG: two-component system phosphate regulon sensor histidine kinase PhoR [Candidatus Azotimanducaceae bacterium]|jgi:two-component system phosphate regulon sensor histidine kinase PhoR
MIKSPILWRLYAGYVVIIFISTTIVGLLVGQQVASNGMNEIQKSLVVQSDMLAELSRHGLSLDVNSVELDELQNTIRLLGQKSDSRLTVIRSDGTVIADSRESPTNMDNHSARPEIIGAMESGQSSSIRFSQTLRQEMSYLARRVDQDQKSVGFVRVSIPLNDIERKATQLRWLVLLGAATSALAALVLGFYFAKRFTDPLRSMTEIAEAISQGDYERRLSVIHKDEIGTLAEAFNRMARSSAERVLEITGERNRLAKILSSMVEGVIGIDGDRRIIHANHAARKLLAGGGLGIEKKFSSIDSSLDTALTGADRELVWEDIRIPELIQAVEKAFETGRMVKVQIRRAASGHDLIVDAHISPLLGELGQVTGVLIVLNDISEIVSLERVRRDFVANASHELKTPITAIRGLTETMLDDPEMDDDTKHRFVERISAQSMRLSVLVSDLLAISRLESDQAERSENTFDLLELVKRSVEAVRPACLEKQLTLAFESNKSPCPFSGDFQSLTQLVDNLMDNAVKYTPVGGAVIVRFSQAADMIRLEVEDTGIGIDDHAQSRVFERFYRVDKARSRDLGGTGLGLSIVKNIAEQHSGTVHLESESGKGSKFIVNFLMPA